MLWCMAEFNKGCASGGKRAHYEVCEGLIRAKQNEDGFGGKMRMLGK